MSEAGVSIEELGLASLIRQLLFVEKYSSLEEWDVTYIASGWRYAFKDDPSVIYHFRRLDARHGAHWALDAGTDDDPSGYTTFKEPGWLCADDGGDATYTRIMGEKREVSVALSLMASEG